MHLAFTHEYLSHEHFRYFDISNGNMRRQKKPRHCFQIEWVGRDGTFAPYQSCDPDQKRDANFPSHSCVWERKPDLAEVQKTILIEGLYAASCFWSLHDIDKFPFRATA